MRTPFAILLGGGDRRSIGAVNAVLAALEADPARQDELFACLESPDALVRYRAFDALEKWSLRHPGALLPLKARLLDGTLDDGSAEVRWHLNLICPRLPLVDAEARALMSRLEADFARHASRIARVMALQGAQDLARAHPALKPRAVAMLAEAAQSPLASLRARARKLEGRMSRS